MEYYDRSGRNGRSNNGRGTEVTRNGQTTERRLVRSTSFIQKETLQDAAYRAEQLRQQRRPVEVENDDTLYDTRMPTSARRYPASETTLPQQATQLQGNPDQPQIRRRTAQAAPLLTRRRKSRRDGAHWLLPLGVGMIAMLVLWVFGGVLVSWWSTSQDDLHYGNPRTAQYDVVVGHSDSSANKSHFIALNFHRHIEVIEFPGGDATHAKVYIGPTLVGAGQDLTPITLEFKDVNRDGKLDMIVHIGADGKYVFLNDNGQFRPLKPNEQYLAT